MKVWRPQTAYALGREAGWDPLMAEVSACGTPEAVDALWAAFVLERHRHYPEGWSLAFRDACTARIDDLLASELHAAMDAAFVATVSP